MSTLNFTYYKVISSSSDIDVVEEVGSGTLTYTIKTSEDSVTCTLSQIYIANSTSTGTQKTYSYSVSFGGSAITSGSDTLGPATGRRITLSASKSVARGHSSSTTSLAVTGSGNGGSANTRISIAVNTRVSYPVAYNTNSGSNAPSPQTKWHNESLTLSSSKPYRNGYVFYHWNTSSSNTGTSYSPGASYTGNAALNLYAIWNPTITYNANGTGVSSLPANATKTYGVTYTIPFTTPVRSGYQFRYWTTNASGTGTTYQAGASYTSNVAVTLYAQWLKVADPPTISSMKVIRCNANGTADDMGTYCYVEAKWSVDTTSAGMATNEGVLTGKITPSINGSTAYTFTSGASGTSGTAKALIENCDTDTTYTVSVTVTNSVVGTGQSAKLATTTADILTSSHFTMDFRRGGEAIGIGSAAPTSGLKVGWKAQFDKDVNIDGNITAANLKYSVIADTGTIFSQIGSNWTCKSAFLYKYGRLVQLKAVFAYNSSISANGNAIYVASIASKYTSIGDLYYITYYGKGLVYGTGEIHFTAAQTVPANTTIGIYIVYMSKA